LSTHPETLGFVDLSANALCDADASAFCSLLLLSSCLSNLYGLSFAHNRIGDAGVASLLFVVRSGGVPNLKRVDLLDTAVSPAVSGELCAALYELDVAASALDPTRSAAFRIQAAKEVCASRAKNLLKTRAQPASTV